MTILHLTEGGYFSRFIVALLLGVLIGLEREWRQRMAGLHTTAMVAAGAAMFTMIAPLLDVKNLDPTRIAAQVVSGIGFLAGGVILRQGANVRGLTTAATLWATAAVGCLVGFGFLAQATGAAFAIVLANITLYPLARVVGTIKRDTRDVATTYSITIDCRAQSEEEVRETILDAVSQTSMSLQSIKSSAIDQDNVVVRAEIARRGRYDRAIEDLNKRLKDTPGVTSTRWEASGEFL